MLVNGKYVPSPSNNTNQTEGQYNQDEVLGRVNIGWTIGEEVLFTFNKKSTLRHENCFSETESCLLGINKSKLAIMQKNLLDSGNSKDYYVLESVLKGNNLIKQKWRKAS